MAAGDQSLLSSYEDGPRIWDAASIVPDVYRLHAQGLIEPVPCDPDETVWRGAYRLTEKGRQALRENQEA